MHISEPEGFVGGYRLNDFVPQCICLVNNRFLVQLTECFASLLDHEGSQAGLDKINLVVGEMNPAVFFYVVPDQAELVK